MKDYAIRPRRFKWYHFPQILHDISFHILETFYLSSFLPRYYFNKPHSLREIQRFINYGLTQSIAFEIVQPDYFKAIEFGSSICHSRFLIQKRSEFSDTFFTANFMDSSEFP